MIFSRFRNKKRLEGTKNIKAYAGEEIEPDERDLEMIEHAKRENDGHGHGIPIEH